MRLIERLKIALLGRKLSDAIKPDVDALVARAGAIRRECQAALDTSAALRVRSLETNHLPEASAANLTALGEVLWAFDDHELRIHRLVAKFHDAEHAMVDRIEALAGVYKMSDADKAQVLEEIAAIRRPASDLHARFLQDFMSLERLWQQWSQPESRSAEQETTPRQKRA